MPSFCSSCPSKNLIIWQMNEHLLSNTVSVVLLLYLHFPFPEPFGGKDHLSAGKLFHVLSDEAKASSFSHRSGQRPRPSRILPEPFIEANGRDTELLPFVGSFVVRMLRAETSGCHHCHHVGTACLRMKPKQRKAKLRGGEKEMFLRTSPFTWTHSEVSSVPHTVSSMGKSSLSFGQAWVGFLSFVTKGIQSGTPACISFRCISLCWVPSLTSLSPLAVWTMEGHPLVCQAGGSWFPERCVDVLLKLPDKIQEAWLYLNFR